MKEKRSITILFIIFLVVGLSIFFFSVSYTEFNFYKSEITVQGKTITETLYYKPDKPYHTLYRNFASPVFSTIPSFKKNNYLKVSNVECSAGEAYVRDYSGRCTYYNQNNKTTCMLYTENNEYGCGFGDTYGFQKGNQYTITATYEIFPENIFIIDGKKYIKFIAYSENKHIKLNENNFIVNGEVVMIDSYASKADVIIYLPYEQDIPNAEKVVQKRFRFDKSKDKGILFLIFSLLPSLILLGVWYFFGKEHYYVNIPEELSFYPKERKPWMIATFFNPPFNIIDQNFFSAMLINFYNMKLIDIKMKKKNPWIKINQGNFNLDKIESDFLIILQNLEHKKLENGYFDLKRDLGSFKNMFTVKKHFSDLQKEVKEKGKEFIDEKGTEVLVVIFVLTYILLQVPIALIGGFWIFPLYFALLLVLMFVHKAGALFIRFKESYYKEYRHWQAFKKYLSHSFSIISRNHEAVKMWDHYLVYATALGVSKKVLKEFKKAHVIDERHYSIYTGIYVSSSGFVASSGASGGAGGGGVGGGGGGGR